MQVVSTFHDNLSKELGIVTAGLQKFITEELAGGALPEGLLGIEPVSDVAE